MIITHATPPRETSGALGRARPNGRLSLSRPRYILITPAFNEEATIGGVLESVARQSVLPERYVIVSDGSTDSTDQIISMYTRRYRWMHYVRRPESLGHAFDSKIRAFWQGYRSVSAVPHDAIGNVDADVSFEPDYFEFLLSCLAADPRLGVVGTPFVEPGLSDSYSPVSDEQHVSGGCQLFRVDCFREVGGFRPLRDGGEDWTAVTTARMLGWRTRSFPQRRFIHHRPIGTGRGATGIRARYEYGRRDYLQGGHPLWEFLRVLRQIVRRPVLIGGLAMGTGFLIQYLKRTRRPVSEELLRFHRWEQMSRLRAILKYGARGSQRERK